MAQVAIINAAAAGDNPLVAAVAGKKIVVKGFSISNLTAAAQSAKFRSSTTDISGLWGIGATIGLIVAHDLVWGPAFYFATVAGQALNLNLAAAVGVGGAVWYELET